VAELFDWLVEAILFTLAVNAVFGLIRRSLSRPAAGPRTAPRGPSERAGGALVRDPQCGTYVPQARALRLGSGPDVHYFCSDGCRAAYAAAHPR